MSRFEAEPHPLLRPYVKSYWGFVRDHSQLRNFTVTPDCFVELIFFVDPPFVHDAGRLRQLPACTLVSLLSEPLRLVVNDSVRCAAVRLQPWAAGIIYPQTNRSPMQAWYDVCPSFIAIAPAVTDALRRAAWSEITPVLDRFLLRAFAGVQPDALALTAVQAFLSQPDGTAVAATADVAAQHGFSRRQIERQVRSLTNRSPKQLASLTRFQLIRDTLWARPDTELHGLAIEAGYADQAHMTRDFRRHAAQSPSEFKRHCLQLKALLSGQDVANVQDAFEEHAYAENI